MTTLQRHAGAGPLRDQDGPSRAQGRSASYTGKMLRWDDIDALPAIPGLVIASAVSDSQVVRTRTGHEQRCTAWAASHRDVRLVFIARQLEEISGGRMKPAGSWLMRGQTSVTAAFSRDRVS